ncbi:MAG TPA: NAD(P)H-dependent oxidoreductase [Pyrinomonadaceae bacterium]|nr:NAD(P)H-dependent oxidoreductase [Pyrinomonadaceae bacterium]
MPKILAFAGSYREHSYNKRVLAVAVEGARAAGAEVTTIDLRDFPLPIYDADMQSDGAFDENALRLQDVMAGHDGFLIASPEYNGSIPGGLKNAIDWVSRSNDKYKPYEPVKGKWAALMTASPGQFGGLRCLAHLRGVLTILAVHVLPMEVAVPFVSQKFDGDGSEMTDEKMKAVLESLGANLVHKLG